MDYFTPEGRREGGVAELHDYASRLLNWRKGASAIHTGKTKHFMTRDNTYAYFRYNETDTVFVFINNSLSEAKVPWSHYAEMVSGPASGRDVITGASLNLSDDTAVPAKTALIAELKK